MVAISAVFAISSELCILLTSPDFLSVAPVSSGELDVHRRLRKFANTAQSYAGWN
jgi:hypothetical protein